MRILVTGHIGFIGSHFVKYLIDNTHHNIIGFSRYSDTGNEKRLVGYQNNGRLRTIWGDLTDKGAISGICEGIDVVVNFAAKTFVDHSLKDKEPFIQSNIIGSDNLMEDATRYKVKCFVQVSTDEVYGQILTGSYKEDATLNPRNPYSWSKACADLNAIQRHRTYNFPCIITRTENNFGPYQHRQKALPTFVRCALKDEPIPVYGDGQHVRCWLDVNEHCRAIWHLVTTVLNQFRIGRLENDRDMFGHIYHIAGEEEMTNLDLAKLVLQTLDKPLDRIKFIPDHNIRPGHDRRYALDCKKLELTGFKIKQNLIEKLKETILWYKDNPTWTQ